MVNIIWRFRELLSTKSLPKFGTCFSAPKPSFFTQGIQSSSILQQPGLLTPQLPQNRHANITLSQKQVHTSMTKIFTELHEL
jgi:hypothetical protein